MAANPHTPMTIDDQHFGLLECYTVVLYDKTSDLESQQLHPVRFAKQALHQRWVHSKSSPTFKKQTPNCAAGRVDKVKAIVEYMHKRTVATDKLRATQQQLGLPESRLMQDCPTRWNSTCYMMLRILENKDAVITTLAFTNPRLAILTPDEWEEIKQACEVLKPFEEVTIEISGEGYVTASKVILLARGLQKITSNLQRAGNLTDSVKLLVGTICQQMSHRFHKIESHTLLSEAAALDPRVKKKAFGRDEDADRAYQHLCNAAARVTFPNQQAEEEEGA
ncbi:hypothetical protein ABVT39_015421 [Epinephelus coioides]